MQDGGYKIRNKEGIRANPELQTQDSNELFTFIGL